MRDQIRVVGAVARKPRLLRIQLAFLGFNMTEYATWIAILVYAYERGGAATAGAVAAIQLVPAGLIAPFGAYAGDRFRRDRALFVSYLGQAVALGFVAVALFADAPFSLTLVFATVATASFTFTRPVQASLLPAVSDGPEELTAANAVASFAQGVGIVVGPFVAGVLLGRWGPDAVFAVFAVVTLIAALLVASLGISDAVWSAPILFGAAGAGGSVAWVAGNTLLQRIAPGEMLARVFGILEGVGTIALAVGSLGASALVAGFGVRVALLATAVLAPTVMLALWVPLSAIDRDAKAPDAKTLRFVRGMPIFAPLSAPAIERIVGNLAREHVPAGGILIREGDVGERFIMIVAGEADVTRAGAHVAVQGAGDHVGEVALLRDVPRNATVTAKTPMTVLTLERAPFIEAVTGHPQSRERVEAIADERLLTIGDDGISGS